MIGRTLSHYRIEAPLGSGGMGVVYRARDLHLEREVALKVLPEGSLADEAARKRFRREALALSRLNHPHIATVFDFDTQDGVDFLVMELVGGEALDERLTGGPLPEPEVMGLGAQIAEALEAAHEQGVVHRDLKPANVLVTAKGQVKVLDFGLSRLLRPREGLDLSRSLTEAEVVVGTVPYMAPEQLLGRKVDARADLYALGVVLYEMATGRSPYQEKVPTALIYEIVNQEVPSPRGVAPQVSERLAAIILRCLAKEPEQRHPTAHELAADLRDASRPVAVPARLRRSGAGARWPRALGVGGIGVATLTAVVMLLNLGGWRERVLGFKAGVAEASAQSILVFPLEVRPPAEGADYAGLAFSESVAMSLAQVESLKVLPVPPSGGVTAGDTENQFRAARRAGARRLLTGSLTRNSNRVQARLVLLDARTKRIVWGVTKDAGVEDLDVLASTVASEVTSRLGVSAPKRYEYFMYYTGGPEIASTPDMVDAMSATRRLDGPAALPPLQRLLERYPNEPELHVLKCMALLDAGWVLPPTTPEVERFRQGLAALARVDPSNPWKDIFGALRMDRDGDGRAAIQEFGRVLARADLTPAARANVLSLRAQAEGSAGDTLAALRDSEEALRLSPADDLNYLFSSGRLMGAGRFEEALVRARQATAINPNAHQNQNRLGMTLSALKRWKEAVDPLRLACELYPRQDYCAEYGYALLRSGRAREARVALEKAAGLPESVWGQAALARSWALAGDRDRAIRLLRRYLELSGWEVDPGWDEDFGSLRGDPGYEAIRSEIRRKLETIRAQK